MRIAITIKLNSGESFQSNGMLQNLVFLARAFDSVEGWDCFFLYISDFDPDLILPKDKCLAFESYILNPPFTFDLVILGGFTTKRFNHQVFEKSKLILFHCGSTLFDDILYSISGNDRSSQLPSLVLDEICYCHITPEILIICVLFTITPILKLFHMFGIACLLIYS